MKGRARDRGKRSLLGVSNWMHLYKPILSDKARLSITADIFCYILGLGPGTLTHSADFAVNVTRQTISTSERGA